MRTAAYLPEDDFPQMIWEHYIPRDRKKFNPSKKNNSVPKITTKEVSSGTPKEWLEAISFNKSRYTISDKWLIYELGFLAGEEEAMNKVIKSGEIGNAFTWLVYKVQVYLSKNHRLTIDGKLGENTKIAMQEWSRETIAFNQKHIVSMPWMKDYEDDFEHVKKSMLKIIKPYDFAESTIENVNNKKDTGNKEFSWLVLATQRILFPFEKNQHDGKFGTDTRNALEKYVSSYESESPTDKFYNSIKPKPEVPTAWAESIKYNQNNFLFEDWRWRVYELGFLSGKAYLIQKVLSSSIGNDFTSMVYHAQKYLAQFYSINTDGKYTQETRNVILKWSMNTIKYNQQHVSLKDHEWIKPELIKLVTMKNFEHSDSDLKTVNKGKGVSSKEFSWLVLSAQRLFFPLDAEQQDGKFGPDTRKESNRMHQNYTENDLGNYAIFVNGLVGVGLKESDRAVPGPEYWRGSYKDPEQFINAAEAYFDKSPKMDDVYVDGSGKAYIPGIGLINNPISDAATRQEVGRVLAVPMITIIKKRLASDPNFEIKQINFVTHSMGAATAEGMIEKFMEDDVLRPLLENGEIIHFSAADADKIVISDNSKKLRRTQINYYGDDTLKIADGGGIMENIVAERLSRLDPKNRESYKKLVGANRTGGYQIPGVTRFGVVIPDPKTVGADHNWHYDTKTYQAAWEFLERLDTILKEDPSQEGKPVFMEMEDKKWAGPDAPLPVPQEKQTT